MRRRLDGAISVEHDRCAAFARRWREGWGLADEAHGVGAAVARLGSLVGWRLVARASALAIHGVG